MRSGDWHTIEEERERGNERKAPKDDKHMYNEKKESGEEAKGKSIKRRQPIAQGPIRIRNRLLSIHLLNLCNFAFRSGVSYGAAQTKRLYAQGM